MRPSRAARRVRASHRLFPSEYLTAAPRGPAAPSRTNLRRPRKGRTAQIQIPNAQADAPGKERARISWRRNRIIDGMYLRNSKRYGDRRLTRTPAFADAGRLFVLACATPKKRRNCPAPQRQIPSPHQGPPARPTPTLRLQLSDRCAHIAPAKKLDTDIGPGFSAPSSLAAIAAPRWRTGIPVAAPEKYRRSLRNLCREGWAG